MSALPGDGNSSKRSTGHTHTHTTAEHTTAEQITHTNTERATAQRRLIVEVVVAALKIVVDTAGGGHYRDIDSMYITIHYSVLSTEYCCKISLQTTSHYNTKSTRAHTQRKLIREWLWEPKGSSLEYI